jgi:hypothetical protein
MRDMRLAGRYRLFWTRLAAAAFVLAGAAACAGVAAPIPHGSAASGITATKPGGLDGQAVFVTAGTATGRSGATASKSAAHRSSSPNSSPTPTASTGSSGARVEAGNPTGQAAVPAAGQAVGTSHPNHVIGSGTPAGCTSAAVVQAVAEGGIITFDCGPKPITIIMTATAKVVNTSHQVVLDGGGKVTLSGGRTRRILYMNTCDAAQKYTTPDCFEQQWPQLVVQNRALTNAYSSTAQAANASYGGGAIFDEGGQLKVVNSEFTSDRCYASGPDLGGGAIRATGMYLQVPVYIRTTRSPATLAPTAPPLGLAEK